MRSKKTIVIFDTEAGRSLQIAATLSGQFNTSRTTTDNAFFAQLESTAVCAAVIIGNTGNPDISPAKVIAQVNKEFPKVKTVILAEDPGAEEHMLAKTEADCYIAKGMKPDEILKRVLDTTANPALAAA